MGWFKKLTGVSSKAVAGAVAGAYVGGPQGAMAGYNMGNSLSGSSSSLGSFDGSSFAQGAIGLGQDMFNAWWNTSQQEKLNDKAYAQNVALWNLQNAYNDPAAQASIQRLLHHLEHPFQAFS